MYTQVYKWIRMTSRKDKRTDPVWGYYTYIYLCKVFLLFPKQKLSKIIIIGFGPSMILIEFNLKKYIYFNALNNYDIVYTNISDIYCGLRINHECHGNNSVI